MAEKRRRTNKFNVGHQNMQVLSALKKKYDRDYLPFFESLTELYVSGKKKKALDQTTIKIKKALTILGDAISEGDIGVTASENLYNLVESIEQDKQFYLEEIDKVKAFQQKFQKVEETTGIPREALNVTREIVREGVRYAHKFKSEGFGERLKERMPSLYGAGARLSHAFGASLLGPFYPAAKLVAGVAGDIGQRHREHQELRLGSKLSSALGPYDSFGDQTFARQQQPDISNFRLNAEGSITKTRMAPLIEFFDKGAYKAKWTKELLDLTKEGKKKRLDFFDGLTSKVIALGAGLLPLLGKAGVIAGLGAATVFTTDRLVTLAGKVEEFVEVQERAQAAIKKQHELQLKIWERLGVRADTIFSEYQAAKSEVAQTTSGILGKMAAREKSLQTAPVTISDPFSVIETPALKKPGNVPAGQVQPIESKLKGLTNTSGAVTDELKNAIKELTEQLQRSQGMFPQSSVGSRFDSGDVLLNEHANGKLVLGE
jgi:hypothetical protein